MPRGLLRLVNDERASRKLLEVIVVALGVRIEESHELLAHVLYLCGKRVARL